MSKLLCLGVGLVCVLPVSTAAGSGGSCWDGDGAARVWSEVMFRPSADLGDYQRTLAQTRDQVRQMLEFEYAGLVADLAPEFEDPEALLEQVLAAVLAFDSVHDRHKEQAAAGVPVYIGVGIRVAVDQLYRSYRIPEESRRLRFAAPDLTQRLEQARSRLESSQPSAQDLETLRRVATTVDLVAHATLAADGPEHQLTLSLENLHTGGLCEFSAKGPLTELNELVARAAFRQFQAVDYPEVIDPNPHLTWVQPGATHPIATAEQAGHYCSTQGARLPYAMELVTASQVGAAGASYVDGGIPRLAPGPWAVADRQRSDAQHFYFEPLSGVVDSHPAGPVRTGAGLGPVRARYWCVQGDPDPRTTRIEDLYATYRELRSSLGTGPATAAVEYLLLGMDALGVRSHFKKAYPNEEVAWDQIWQAHCVASAETSAGTLAADRPGPRVCPTPERRYRGLVQGNAVN